MSSLESLDTSRNHQHTLRAPGTNYFEQGFVPLDYSAPQGLHLSAMLREPNEGKAPQTTGPKRPVACFRSHLHQKNDLLKAVLLLFDVLGSAHQFFQDLAKRFVTAHHATARLREPAPPSTKHTLHPCPLSLMEPDCTCDELGPFRAAPRSRRDSTSRRGVKLKGCAAGWASRC